METRFDPRKDYRTTLWIGAAMIVSLGGFALCVEALERQMLLPAQPQTAGTVRDIALGSVVVVMIAIRMVRNALLRPTATDTLQLRVRRLKASTLATLALCEVPAGIGFGLYLVGGYAREFYVLLLLSLAAMVLYFPRERHWAAWLGLGLKF